MVKKNKGIAFLLVLLGLISLVSAAAVEIQIGDFDTGFIIEHPIFSVVKQNTTFDYSFYVFNKSNGKVMTFDDISCVFNLYEVNGTRTHISNFKVLQLYNGFQVIIDKGNFSEVGHKGYTIRCNDSKLGGFVTNAFDVTRTGHTVGQCSGYFSIIMWSLLIVSLMLGFLMYVFRPTEDSNLGLHISIMRMILFFMCLYTLLNALAFAGVVSNSMPMETVYFTPLESTLELFVYFIWIAAIITILFFIFDLFWTFKKFGEKG